MKNYILAILIVVTVILTAGSALAKVVDSTANGFTEPGKILRMTGGLGPLQQFAVSGVMTVEFKAEGQGANLTFTYTVGGYIPGGFEKLAPLVDQVMVQQ